MNFEWTIEIENKRTGRTLIAHVKVLIIAGKAASQILCKPKPTDEEQQLLERMVEDRLSFELGGAPVTYDGSEHFTDRTKLQARMRQFLGGGQG